MDSTAVKEIHDNAAAIALSLALTKTFVPIAALPSNFQIHSLEKYQPTRSRFSGVLDTVHLPSFVGYHQSVNESASVYVNPEDMSALTIFDVGTIEAPGHCEHKCKLQLQATAPFKALRDLAAKREATQRELAEWIEDWRDYLQAIDSEDAGIDIKKLAATIRNITIEGIRKSDTTEDNFASSKTALEKIEAKSGIGSLPKVILFKCQPYAELPEQEFRFRLSIRTGGDKPMFAALRIREELDTEQTAENFVNVLRDELNAAAAIYQGKFKV